MLLRGDDKKQDLVEKLGRYLSTYFLEEVFPIWQVRPRCKNVEIGGVLPTVVDLEQSLESLPFCNLAVEYGKCILHFLIKKHKSWPVPPVSSRILGKGYVLSLQGFNCFDVFAFGGGLCFDVEYPS